ncbi:MAG: tRNA pseudouridine(38-40) synthase TruA [Epsilonproteobacteria bacterium]|nr:tRNA pseudouridine(38-40) synthase TruA [Campylobacterota bacterium]
MQTQPHKNTIEDHILYALDKLSIHASINYAGRTDSGVHALNQSIDFVVPDFWSDLSKLKYALNNLLAPFIRIKRLLIKPPNFHSRFDALARSYRYVITNHVTPFNYPYVLYANNLDLELLQKALYIIQGKHDFRYFCKTGSQNHSFVREIYSAQIINYKNYVIIRFVANGFLRSQIRLMTAFLLEIANKNLTLNDLQQQIEAKKLIYKKTSLPNGLYFERAWYENFVCNG